MHRFSIACVSTAFSPSIGETVLGKPRAFLVFVETGDRAIAEKGRKKPNAIYFNQKNRNSVADFSYIFLSKPCLA